MSFFFLTYGAKGLFETGTQTGQEPEAGAGAGAIERCCLLPVSFLSLLSFCCCSYLRRFILAGLNDPEYELEKNVF